VSKHICMPHGWDGQFPCPMCREVHAAREEGFRAGVAAAAKVADDRLQNGRESGCGRAIRALAPDAQPRGEHK
jgi:hypothetical protein